jgi:hypothetical protein
MAEATGIAAVLAEADLTGAPPGAEAEQLDLCDLLGLPAARLGSVTFADQVRGRGRPAGARNKRTVEWANYLTRRYGSPLEVLAQIATTSVTELRDSLACSALEALGEKRLAAIALLPYIHQRQPLAVDLTNRQVVYLSILDAAAAEPGAGDEGDMTLIGALVNIVENQPLSEAPGDAV